MKTALQSKTIWANGLFALYFLSFIILGEKAPTLDMISEKHMIIFMTVAALINNSINLILRFWTKDKIVSNGRIKK